MGSGPLADSRLQEIESKLNAGRFDEAQRLLSTIGNLPNAETASAYFATRLLFQRGRMDPSGVIQRLRELLQRVPDFPEAARMLAAAEAGILEPGADVFRRVTGAPVSEQPTPDVAVPTRRIPTQQEIPRAPLVPRFTPRTGTPSYAPTTPLAPRDDTPREMPRFPGLNTLPGVGPGAAALPPIRELTTEEREHMPTLSAPAGPLPIIPSLQIPTINTVSTLPPPEAPAIAAPVATPEKPADPKTRSGAYSVRPHSPSLFEIAAAIDAGDPSRALELSEQAEGENGPELTLLAARAQLALGERGRAWGQVERVLRSPNLSPAARATAARVLMDLGRLDAALDQAKRSHNEEPAAPLSQVTYAWALTRALRRQGKLALADEAEKLIENLRLREGPLAPLLLGVRAVIAAERKDATRALSLAQSALAQDARQLDAIAAIALASALLGKPGEAEKAQRRLRELSPDEATANQNALARHGVNASSEAAQTTPWGDTEVAFVTGKSSVCLDELKRAADECLRATPKRGSTEAWQVLGQNAARVLTELPVFRHFCPYDCSLFSVERLEVGLSLLFGSEGGRDADEATIQLLGAYFGESLRQAFGAEWQGVPAFPYSASIEGIGLSLRPCERIRDRLQRGTSLVVEPPHAMHPGADPLGNSVPLSLAPPAPWDPSPFPSLEDLSELGRSLGSSVIGVYCERTLGLPLDLSISGTVAIDRYVALLAPSKAPPDPEAGWGRRAALLLGAYLGEVLVDAVGARWEVPDEIYALDGYRLLLPNGSVATPVSRVLDRLAGRRTTPLSEYVARLASGRTSVSA